MTPPANTADPQNLSWESLVLANLPVRDVWAQVFKRLGEVALATPSPAALHRETIVPDRLIAESAWDLWQQFPSAAPKVIDGVRDFWAQTTTTAGAAVLILDALSLRELPLIVTAARKRGVPPTRVSVAGSQVPSDTNQFAAALGLPGRSKLSNNQPPQSFIFGGPDVHTDVLQDPFADCVCRIPAKARLFIWHKWPDEPLIHGQAERADGDAVVAAEVKRTIASDGFWAFVNALRQGRRLLINGDHGYATAADFSSEIKDDQAVRQFAGAFGAQRAIREDPAEPWPRRQLPPYVLRFPEPDGKTWLVVLGQRKWRVRGGFPTLCHMGLSLLEAAVPMIELPPA
jgi:hypothetical protein